MKIVSYYGARSSVKAVLDRVYQDADVTVISRRDGADALVAFSIRFTSAAWADCAYWHW